MLKPVKCGHSTGNLNSSALCPLQQQALNQDESQVTPNAVLGELLYHHHVATLYQ